MCVSPADEEFLGAIDTSGHIKDAVLYCKCDQEVLD
jgi:hypothetical protein